MKLPKKNVVQSSSLVEDDLLVYDDDYSDIEVENVCEMNNIEDSQDKPTKIQNFRFGSR